MSRQFDLLIIGGGVSGTALLHAASRYTNLKRIGLIEKYPRLASVNSSGRHNSQTLHCGDIETNYSLDKALYVKTAADMVVNYACQQENPDRLIRRYSKMVLGVGEEECNQLERRFETFGAHYPTMQWLDAKRVAEIEPNVALVKGRPRIETIAAMGAVNDYTAVDFEALSLSFAESAKTANPDVQINLGTLVKTISRTGDRFQALTNNGVYESSAVVVSAGGHSLLLAHQMQYGLEYSVFPMAGSFYFTPRMLNGKVYTVQNDKLPFAAIHGDPDILVDEATRFGPTALMLPMLERYQARSILDFFKVFSLDRNVAKVLLDLLRDRDIRNYILKNFLYEVPVLRRYLFLLSARKIVPSLRFEHVRYANGFGGIRPQLINKKTRQLQLGEAKINQDDGIIFNMTPSPGATSCLQNAQIDLQSVCRYLDVDFDNARFNDELLPNTPVQEKSINNNVSSNAEVFSDV